MDLARTMTWPHMRLGHLKDEMDNLFRSAFDSWPDSANRGSWHPALDVVADADKVTITAELPGMEKQDVELQLNGNILTISGEKKQRHTDESGNRYYSECSYGHFTRQISLPDGLDAEAVEAEFNNGVLKVTVPKSEAVKPKRIELK